MKAQSFKEFRDSKRTVSTQFIEAELGMIAYEETQSALLYSAGMIEKLNDGTFYLNIQRNEYKGELELLERILYLEWAISEVFEFSLDHAIEWLEMFCEWRGLEVTDARELLLMQMKEQSETRSQGLQYNVDWLEWFIAEWEAAENE